MTTTLHPVTTPTRLPDGILSSDTVALVRQSAVATDQNPVDLRPFLQQLATEGVADLGLADSTAGVVQQGSVIAQLAEQCVSSAFSLWAHRMATEYLVTYGDERTASLATTLRSGTRPGATAMAAAFNDLAGRSEMPLTFTRQGDQLVLNGFIPWASNLYPDAVVVTVARSLDQQAPEKIVVAVPVASPGLTVNVADQLLALNSTRSGSISLADTPVSVSNIVTEDVVAFTRSMQPVFLALQSSFCLGLATAALTAAPEPSGPAEVFRSERDDLLAQRDHLEARLVSALEAIDLGQQRTTSSYLQLRLDAAVLAGAASQLEVRLTGGRGYVASSPTARRMREALFLPIQSPTESQLRWELSHSV